MSKKKSSSTNVFLKDVNMHLAFIAITLCAGIAAGAIFHQSRLYNQAVDQMDQAVLGAMTGPTTAR